MGPFPAAVAVETSHEELLIAIVSMFGAVLVASIPLWRMVKSTRQTAENTLVTAETGLEDVSLHMPPNGKRLYEMVEATDLNVGALQRQLAKMEVVLMQHIEWSQLKHAEEEQRRDE